MMFLIQNSEYLRFKPIVEDIIQNKNKDEKYINNIIGYLNNIPTLERIELMNKLLDYYESVKENIMN